MRRFNSRARALCECVCVCSSHPQRRKCFFQGEAFLKKRQCAAAPPEAHISLVNGPFNFMLSRGEENLQPSALARRDQIFFPSPRFFPSSVSSSRERRRRSLLKTKMVVAKHAGINFENLFFGWKFRKFYWHLLALKIFIVNYDRVHYTAR